MAIMTSHNRFYTVVTVGRWPCGTSNEESGRSMSLSLFLANYTLLLSLFGLSLVIKSLLVSGLEQAWLQTAATASAHTSARGRIRREITQSVEQVTDFFFHFFAMAVSLWLTECKISDAKSHGIYYVIIAGFSVCRTLTSFERIYNSESFPSLEQVLDFGIFLSQSLLLLLFMDTMSNEVDSWVTSLFPTHRFGVIGWFQRSFLVQFVSRKKSLQAVTFTRYLGATEFSLTAASLRHLAVPLIEGGYGKLSCDFLHVEKWKDNLYPSFCVAEGTLSSAVLVFYGLVTFTQFPDNWLLVLTCCHFACVTALCRYDVIDKMSTVTNSLLDQFIINYC